MKQSKAFSSEVETGSRQENASNQESGAFPFRFNRNGKGASHEVFFREEKLKAGSDRTFGLVMALALSAVTALNAWHSGRLWPWTGGVAALLLAAAVLRPSGLHPLNLIWLRFGLLLHKVVNPVVMALLFYGTVLPTGLIMRWLGKDLLRLKREPGAESYWIVREPPGPSPETMKDQF